MFTHVLNGKNKKLINIDNVGPLRDNGKKGGQAFPPCKWQAGKIYVDEQGYADRLVKVVHDESHQLIEEFVVCRRLLDVTQEGLHRLDRVA